MNLREGISAKRKENEIFSNTVFYLDIFTALKSLVRMHLFAFDYRSNKTKVTTYFIHGSFVLFVAAK